MSSRTSTSAPLEKFDRVRHMSTDHANHAIDTATRESIQRATAMGFRTRFEIQAEREELLRRLERHVSPDSRNDRDLR